MVGVIWAHEQAKTKCSECDYLLHTAAYKTDILHNVNIGRHFVISYEQISIGIIKSHNIMDNIYGKLSLLLQ